MYHQNTANYTYTSENLAFDLQTQPKKFIKRVVDGRQVATMWKAFKMPHVSSASKGKNSLLACIFSTVIKYIQFLCTQKLNFPGGATGTSINEANVLNLKFNSKASFFILYPNKTYVHKSNFIYFET